MVTSLKTKDITLRPFGGNLAIGSDPTEVWSTSPVLLAADEWVDMFEWTFEPLERGEILWIYVYIKWRVSAAASATADVIERIRARNVGDAYQNISDELATANINVNWVTRTTSGYILPLAGLNRVPTDFLVQMQTNELNEGRLEVSSESFIRIVFKER